MRGAALSGGRMPGRVRPSTVLWTAALTTAGAVAVGTGGLLGTLALGVAAIGLATAVAAAVVTRRGLRGVLSVEVPVLLLLVSNLVWRVRTTDEIASDPLDAAGLVRVGFMGLAGLLALMALVRPAPAGARTGSGRPSLPFRLYVAYILVVFAGAPLSVEPLLTAYRGVELATAALVLVAATHRLGQEAVPRIGATLYWFLVALVGTVWAGAALVPSRAFEPLLNQASPIPWNLSGAYPSIAPNGVGTLGVTLTIWSLARATTGGRDQAVRPALLYLLAGVGLVTLLASQYRTGYGALAVGLAVLLALRSRWLLLVLLVLGAAAALVFVTPATVRRAEPYLLRGQSAQEARSLTSRVQWWEASIPVWRKSPLIGRGLLTGTRFEVLARLGLRDTGGIHSTWVEALVGTGLIGLGLFLAALLVSLRRAAALALGRHRVIVPLLLLLVLSVRSATGNTFESFQGLETVLFLWLALSLGDAGRAWWSAPTPAPGRALARG
jgi:O-antigen ligase